MTSVMDGPSFAEISEIYCIVFVSFIISSFCIVLVIFKRQGLTPAIRLSRHSDDSIMDYETPGTVMVGVTNPYVLTVLQAEKATLKDGVQLKLKSSVPCKVTSFWGLDCDVLKHILCVQKRRLVDTHCTDTLTEKAIAVNESDYLVPGETRELHLMTSRLDDDDQLGPPPRLRYPLVVIVTSTESQLEAVQTAVIESLVAIIHLPDASYNVPCHMISQLLQTNTKHVYDLQRMYIAADTTIGSSPTNIGTENTEQIGDCTVCQTNAITRVILPCKHACCCDSCFPLLNMCPICRGYIYSYFRLGEEPRKEVEEVVDDGSLLGRFYRFNDWLNSRLGFP